MLVHRVTQWRWVFYPSCLVSVVNLAFNLWCFWIIVHEIEILIVLQILLLASTSIIENGWFFLSLCSNC